MPLALGFSISSVLFSDVRTPDGIIASWTKSPVSSLCFWYPAITPWAFHDRFQIQQPVSLSCIDFTRDAARTIFIGSHTFSTSMIVHRSIWTKTMFAVWPGSFRVGPIDIERTHCAILVFKRMRIHHSSSSKRTPLRAHSKQVKVLLTRVKKLQGEVFNSSR